MARLPAPECRLGYPKDQLRSILGDRYDEFMKWMGGQTACLCEGKEYDHETKVYKEACGGVSHGMVVYPWDLERFLKGLPVID